MDYLKASVEDLKSPRIISPNYSEDLNISTQNRILELSLKTPLTGKQYKEAMEKHLAEQRVPIHMKKWESMSDEEKADRTIKKAAIQHELQLANDELERQVSQLK